MIDLKSSISRIEALLEQNTTQSATYAALEARLTIEGICYDRLRIAHDYISHDDLRRWQPKDVVLKLLQDVDDQIASNATLSISSQPAENPEAFASAADYEGVQWLTVGKQVGFDAKQLGKLWQALSNLALHVSLPKSKSDTVSIYGNEIQIREKVKDALVEFRRLASGTLLMSGFGVEVSFNCDCGRTIKRRLQHLKEGQVISCTGPDCLESFEVTLDNDEAYFERRVVHFDCLCGRRLGVLTKRTERLKFEENKAISLQCESCSEEFVIAWKLMKGPKRKQ